MVKNPEQNKASKSADALLSDAVKDSAQQIWQAGLGAFNKAQIEGSKAFEALVKEGVSLQRKTQSATEERLSQASHKMSSMASDISSKAVGQWDKLEGIFEERVSKALNKLGVPSAQDISALIARIDALNESVSKLTPKRAAPKAAAKVKARARAATATPAAAKPVRKTAAKAASAAAAGPKRSA